MATSGSALFLDFGIILLVAGAVALLFYYLKQPVVLGYLLAGVFVGPFSPGPSFVSDAEVMAFMGEVGIVFLLFALGLEFNLRKLRKVGAVVILAGTIEIAIMLGLGYSLGQLLGWSAMQSIFLGAIISISSTTVIVKVLGEMGKKDEEWAQTAFGILIIEDVLAVLILTALSSAGATGNFAPGELLPLVYKLGIFMGAALLLGLLFAPKLVDKLAVVRVEEVMVILTCGIGFGMAILAGSLGFSAGLGAFVAGALMAESPRVQKIEHKIHPLRDVFTAIFFVTVGAALDPRALVANWGPIILVTLAVIGGKVFAVTLATFVTGGRPAKAFRVGTTLAQIGEFAFIIAVLGVSLSVIDPALYAIAIGVSAITSFVTPHLIRGAPTIIKTVDRHLPAGLRAYAIAYSTWIARAKRSDRDRTEWRAIRNNIVTAVLNGAVIVAIFALGATFASTIHDSIARVIGETLAFSGIEWVLLSLLIVPFAYMWVRELREIIVDLARLAVPQRLMGKDCTTTERLLRRTFGFSATISTAVFCVVVGGLFVDNIMFILLVAGAGVGVGSIVLGTSLRKFHDEVETTIARMTGGEETPLATREEAMHMLEHSHAWGAGSREVRLPDVSGGAGRTIGQLRMRELTGASVVSVRRAGMPTLTNPGPALELDAGDLVMIVGDDESLTRAEEILLGRDLGIEGGATEIIAPASAAGKTLGDLELGTGVEVLVVRRHGNMLQAHDHLTIETGDVLVVMGSAAQVEAAARRLSV